MRKPRHISSGFNSSAVDPCFYRKWKSGDLTLIALFVDDFYIAADNESGISVWLLVSFSLQDATRQPILGHDD